MKPIAVACCSKCYKSDPEELHQSVTDFIVIDQLWAYKSGKREGIIKSDNAFMAWREEAIKNGVFERETARHRKFGIETEIDPPPPINFLNKTTDFHTDLLLKAIFKKNHEKN